MYHHRVRFGDGSPSSRGRGLKSPLPSAIEVRRRVALFTRAWIEIRDFMNKNALPKVALFTRAWIEMRKLGNICVLETRRPLHEGVD